MGLDYSYEIVTTHAGAENTLRVLTRHLHPDDRDRILDALGHGITEFEKCVQRNTRYENGYLCLCFLFPPDEALSASSDLLDYEDATGRVALSCVDLTLRLGEKYVLLRNTAVTTTMSLLFAQSPNIRETFRQIGQESDALLVTFDDEQDDALAIWPHEKRLGTSYFTEWEADEDADDTPPVDRYVPRLLERRNAEREVSSAAWEETNAPS